MSIKGELLIRGGTVVDPARGVFGKADVLIHNGIVMDSSGAQQLEAERTIEADGLFVLPGLIDYHTHVFHGGTDIGIFPDSALLPQGVTTAVDQGSAGITNFESFYKSVVAMSQVRVFSHLHVSPAGLATLTRCLEPVDPRLYDSDRIERLLRAYSSQILGLKIRQSKEIVGEWGVEPLAATVGIAEKLGCRVVVHTTNPPREVDEILSLLRPGDVFTHVFQGKGSNIIDEQGKVRPSVRQARSKGVIFDTADGRGHYAFSVAKAALAEGFEPDIISTDLVKGSLFDRSVFGLPLIMSKYISLGMSLDQVVKACTATPARIIGMEGKLGTLAPGAHGDVAIFELSDKQLSVEDVFGERFNYKQLLLPRLTVLNGRVVYRSLEI